MDEISCLQGDKKPIVKSMPADNDTKDFTNAIFHINCIMSKENFIKFMHHHLSSASSAILSEVNWSQGSNLKAQSGWTIIQHAW